MLYPLLGLKALPPRPSIGSSSLGHDSSWLGKILAGTEFLCTGGYAYLFSWPCLLTSLEVESPFVRNILASARNKNYQQVNYRFTEQIDTQGKYPCRLL